jgi:predicted metalloprotease with PDZ domain
LVQLLRAFRVVAILLIFCLPNIAREKLTYQVEYSTARSRYLHVVIVPAVTMKGPVTLVIPRAIPSGYAQQFYDRYVENVKATSSAGLPLAIAREDGPRWRVGTIATDVARLDYDVDLSRLEHEILDASSVSKARPEYVGLLGYSVLGYLEGSENSPVRVEVRAPEGWPVFTTLAPKVPTDTTVTAGEAKNFYALADSQIVMGPKFKARRLESTVPLFLLVYAEVETDLNRTGEIFADAFRKVSAYFGDVVPFVDYTAHIEILKPISEQHGYGFSMEHINSSTYFLGVDRAITPNTTPQQIARERYNFAHHVAHSWIPKRVFGTGYLPFTWELAPQIETIWFNEGFARFVIIEALADAMPEAEGQQFRGQQFDVFQRTLATIPDFIRSMPLLELSRVGSLVYGSDFRTGRTLFIRGAFMAAEMDERIRKLTNGKKRLRDSLRSLVKWGEKSGRAFRTEELPGLIARPVGVSEREVRVIMERWLATKSR